ncbi:helix-turn-helix domain-containing protein [Streptomyces sp. NPDC050509]|uniref:helix-turn-helix domain-containing protein n=1 Tax=Streptomyces sp. NPDC050509 TaxID=3365620 RepID=UPI0037AC0EB2
MVLSAGRMSGLWSGRPVPLKLEDMDVICVVLGREISDLLIPEPGKVNRPGREETGRVAVSSGTAAPVLLLRRWRPSAATAGRFRRNEPVSEGLSQARLLLRQLFGLGRLQRTSLPCLLHVRPQLREASSPRSGLPAPSPAAPEAAT